MYPLITSTYLSPTGIDFNALHAEEQRLSQESMNDPGKRRNGLRASQGDASTRRSQRVSQKNLRSSQGGLQKSRSDQRLSQGNLRASQGDEERVSLTASQGGEDDTLRSEEDTQRAALLDEDALRSSISDDSRDALRSSQGEDSALRKSQDDITAQAQAQEDAGEPMTPRKGSARYSSFFSSTSYANINYYEEFCALFPHFAIVPTEGYRVELGGRLTGDQELFLQEQDAHNLAYQKIFQKNGKPPILSPTR